MYEFYSEKVTALLKKESAVLLIPDLILIKEGVACGDRLILSGQVDESMLRFDFSAESACILSHAACCLCKELYQARPLIQVRIELTAQLTEFSANPRAAYALFEINPQRFSHRLDCLIAPFQLLLDWIEAFEKTSFVYGVKPDTRGNLECDACVSACRINWDFREPQPINYHRNNGQGGEYLKNWLTLGKIELLPEDVPLLKRMCSHMTRADHQFLSDCTINTFVLHHLLRYAPELVDAQWKAAAYLIQKNEINRGYFEAITRYIQDERLNIYFVKGYVSQKYYDFPSLRIHSDYDIIAADSTDAFRLTNHLMHNGFTIRPNLFSLKTMSHQGKSVVSGHFHVQKIIDDAYLLELDISFPGFPINRVELFYPNIPVGKELSIRTEEQIVITLLHLFKHSDIYMKDINDLYYMLRQPSLKLERLRVLLCTHQLTLFFNLALSFIVRDYPSSRGHLEEVLHFFQLDEGILDRYPGWPYDLDAHRKVKQEDLGRRMVESADSERKYLYPVVIFQKIFSFTDLESALLKGFTATPLLNTVYEIARNGYMFYLTPIGILIDSYIDTSQISRLGFIEEIKDFLRAVGHQEFFPIPFATEHFYVRIF